MKGFLIRAALAGLLVSIGVGVWIWIARLYADADTAAAAARELCTVAARGTAELRGPTFSAATNAVVHSSSRQEVRA